MASTVFWLLRPQGLPYADLRHSRDLWSWQHLCHHKYPLWGLQLLDSDSPSSLQRAGSGWAELLGVGRGRGCLMQRRREEGSWAGPREAGTKQLSAERRLQQSLCKQKAGRMQGERPI